MTVTSTPEALAAVTDEGLFELLATAVLRESDQTYASLVHSGVNTQGKTVKSPVDGVTYEVGATPPHMIAAHHTSSLRKDLKKKWLHDPTTVKPKRGKKPTAPAGDVVKTLEIANKERKRLPDLKVTLVLTTNKEPGEALVRDVNAMAANGNISIDIWSGSRLAHFLDNKPTGQWLRAQYLGISQELLSLELYRELCTKSLEQNRPPSDPATWIRRRLDNELNDRLRGRLTFLMAGSGLGKTVACYRELQAHVENGGLGLVLTHDVVEAANSLDQATTQTLQGLYPALHTNGLSPLSFATVESPAMFVVEDINRSSNPQALVEKLAAWADKDADSETTGVTCWQLLCPLWPKTLALMDETCRRRIEPLVLAGGSFDEEEGRNAVLARAAQEGLNVTGLQAAAISRALGHDPLLIALHNQETSPDAHKTIADFAENCLSRLAARDNDYLPAGYREALLVLGSEMLRRRVFDLAWHVVQDWPELSAERRTLLSRLAQQGDLLRLVGTSSDQKVDFRHDRVREWVLAESAAHQDRKNELPEDVLADPYYAEVMGTVLARCEPSTNFPDRAKSANPLSLFHALRLFGETKGERRGQILQAIEDWLSNAATQNREYLHLCWEAIAVLADTDAPAVPDLVSQFSDRTVSVDVARLRNGDLQGGIELCVYLDPGTNAPWRDANIEHAKLQHGSTLLPALVGYLERPDLNDTGRVGALRLAGHFGDENLVSAIEQCWKNDEQRTKHLDAYLWAFAECCSNDVAIYLEPVCNAWASLPDKPEKDGHIAERNEISQYGLRWAFQKWPPTGAIDYFIKRAEKDDLQWPLTVLLHGIDDPRSVLFTASRLADIQRRIAGTNSFSHFGMSVRRHWQEEQEKHGRVMSEESRTALELIWTRNDKDIHLRKEAFSLWAATLQESDVELLRPVDAADELYDRALEARLRRNDPTAIPALISKLEGENSSYWWQCGRQIWSSALTKALDESLRKRGDSAKRTWGEMTESDWITSEMIMRLSVDDAEKLLLTHWNHLRYSPNFIQAALYTCTETLMPLAEKALNECDDAKKLLEHFSMHVGIRTKGRAGITRQAQITALAPYLELLSPVDLSSLWTACNDHGWFDFRRKTIDPHLKGTFKEKPWDSRRARMELDQMVAKKSQARVPYWVEESIAEGVSWPTVLGVLKAWLTERRDLAALKVVAMAVEHQGTRVDLDALTLYEDMDKSLAEAVVIDTTFAVRRRSLA